MSQPEKKHRFWNLVSPASFSTVSLSFQEIRAISCCAQEPELRLSDWKEKEEEDDHGENDGEDKGCTGWNARGALHHSCCCSNPRLSLILQWDVWLPLTKNQRTHKCKTKTDTNMLSRGMTADCRNLRASFCTETFYCLSHATNWIENIRLEILLLQ